MHKTDINWTENVITEMQNKRCHRNRESASDEPDRKEAPAVRVTSGSSA